MRHFLVEFFTFEYHLTFRLTTFWTMLRAVFPDRKNFSFYDLDFFRGVRFLIVEDGFFLTAGF